MDNEMLSPKELLASWETLDEETLDSNLDALIERYAINRPSARLRQSEPQGNPNPYKGIAY